MRRSSVILSSVLLGSAAFGLAGAASAQDYGRQDYGTMRVGNAEISIGAGVANLDLPDIRFGVFTDNLTTEAKVLHKVTNAKDFFDEFGPSIGGELVVPWGGATAFAVSGFFSNIDSEDTRTCRSTAKFVLGGGPTDGGVCTVISIVDDPDQFNLGAASEIKSRTKRDVDNWGGQAEGRYYLNGSPLGGKFLKSNYLSAGFDARGIDQDNTIRFNLSLEVEGLPNIPDSSARYRENLDTNYYGGYVSYGGEYTLFPNLASSLGLQSFFKARAGLYNASTDYSGFYQLNSPQNPNINQTAHLSLSDDKAAFIGSLSLETRKQIGPRTSLSLYSDYEWYSDVPSMRYNDTDVVPGAILQGQDNGTHIDYDSAWSTRTMLRLVIGLGSNQLYSEPLK